MYLQIITFDGPRSAAEVAASERAGRERITPLFDADPQLREQLLAGYRCVGPDGAEALIALVTEESAFDRMRELVQTSQLLPGEDPELLRGPSRVQHYEVTDVLREAGAVR